MFHESIATLQGEDVVFTAIAINRPGAGSCVMIQSCFGHHFRLLLEKRAKCKGCEHFYALVQLIGTRKQAEKFKYRLEVNGQGRRVTWEAITRSIHEAVAATIEKSHCLGFEARTAKLLANDGNLSICVSIRMV
jgi:hypothetical protein